MLCPKCQHRNPDENRFCGHCGTELPRSASTNYPPAGYDEGEVSPVSEVDSTVPHFRRDVPPLAQSEYGPPAGTVRNPPVPSGPDVTSDREVVTARIPDGHEDEVRDPALAHETPSMEHSIPPNSVASSQPPVRQPIRDLESPPEPPSFGSSTGILFNLDPRETRTPERQDDVHPVDRSAETVSTPRRSEGIHGPSFLGLADGADPDFLDDIDEPESHSRRNWFLVALAIVIVLGIVEWRNIRETGMNFAGSMKLSLPGKKGEPPKPADTAATDHPSENGSDGEPEMVVNPENKSTTDAQSNSQQQGDAQSAHNSSAAQQGSTGQQAGSKAASTGTRDMASAASTNNPPAQQAKNNASKPPNAAADSSDDNSGAENAPDEEAAAKVPAKPAKTSRTPTAPAPSAGAEELARANTASSPETAAKWLWASTSKGNLDAPVRLADMYAQGRGVPKDCEQATVLLRSSARRGNPRASARLGMYYATGQCVGLDRSQAWHWLSLAHQRDPASDWITQYRQRLWSEMTADERARAGVGPTANASE